MKKAVIAVISDLATDRRVMKLASLMAGEGLDVTVIGRRSDVSVPASDDGIRLYRIKIPFRKGPAMYVLFNLLLFIRLLFRRHDVCVACDLDTLVPCYITSRLMGRALIYDSHEYFTGQYGLEEKRIRRFLWKTAERMTVSHLKHIITVSDSIAEIYRHEYGVDPLVVRNMATDISHLQPRDRKEMGVPHDELLAVYQGSGINPGRGAEELIRAMSLTNGIRLLIIGSGDNIGYLQKIATESPASERIIFLPRMPWEEMMRYTMCCDAGLSLDSDTCINQRYSLPNKLFDYIAAGIPSVVSDLPEVSALVMRYGCGIVLKELSPESIASGLMRLSGDRQLLSSLKQKTQFATMELSWEREKVREQELIRSVIESKSSK